LSPVDGIGVYLGGRPNLKRLSSAGVQVALFVSPLRSALRGRTNLRNHRKMVIVDGAWLWCGGRNLAAEYFEDDPKSMRKHRAWVDLSFDLRGALAQQGQQRFDQDWDFATTGKVDRPLRPTVPTRTAPGMSGQLVASGPDQTEDTVYTLLVSACFTAHSRILAVTPYFVPDPTLLMALTLAARRGVAVDLLLPRRSNHHLADIARHSALREFTAAGGKVWLAPGMIHAKAVLIDNALALTGSANLDERSLFLNYELMVAFYEPSVVQSFATWIESQRSSAKLYHSHPPGLVLELAEGLVRWVAFQL
jgi:cardiolipin synthase